MLQQRIVITGTSGFVGSRAAKYFAKNFPESNIVATSRNNNKQAELENAGCVFLSGDLQNISFCEQLLKGADVLIHCAALSQPWGASSDFYHANFELSKKLLEIAVLNNVGRFIYISSASIYFSFADRFNLREDQSKQSKFINNYAHSKFITEEYLLSQNNQGIKTIALRPRAIIGAEDSVIFPRVLRAYHAGRLRIIGRGENVCDLTCVQNLVHALECCINAEDSAYGQAYNITDGQPIKFWEVLSYALDKLGLSLPNKRISKQVAILLATINEVLYRSLKIKSEPILLKYAVGIMSNSITLNIGSARTQLKYNPTQTTLSGIDEFVEWYKTTQQGKPSGIKQEIV